MDEGVSELLIALPRLFIEIVVDENEKEKDLVKETKN